jgi:hypothetical protein
VTDLVKFAARLRPYGRSPARYAFQRLIRASWVDSDAALVAGAVAFAVAAGHVFALIVEFAVGAAAPPAVFLHHWPSVAPGVGGPDPASVEVSGVPGPASLGAFAALAGISGLASRCHCLGQQGAEQAVGLSGGQQCLDGQRCSPQLQAGYEQLRPLLQVQQHDR